MTPLRTLFPLIVLCVCARGAELNPPVMPLPAHVKRASGSLKIDASFRVKLEGYGEPRLERAALRLISRLDRETGITLRNQISTGPAPVALTLHCQGSGKQVQSLGEDESYRLAIAPSGARLDAAQPLGILHGLETFLQLIEPGPEGFAAPAMEIDDSPRFPWRGLLLDVSRHFMPVDEIKRTLDGMAVVKLNVFHWHLSDNQGFRVESRVFPLLQELGSGGLYYTQDEIRELIAYARDRGIRVIPEFDMPGHATGILVAYPQLAAPPAPREIDHVYGVLDPVMDPSNPAVYDFLDRFIGEMAQLFPDAYFHIGGDEVNGKLWRESVAIQQFKRQHGMAGTPEDPDANAAFHAYFNQRLQQIVQKHGKRMEGWDEILSPSLPRSIVIQSWRGQKSLAEAARQGYHGILSSGWYLDLAYPAAKHYLVDPLANETADLTPDQQKLILGGEAAMWSEYITPETADGKIWPRAAAIAERLWSPRETRNIEDMYRRLDFVSAQLEYAGLTHLSWQRRMLDRLAGNVGIAPLRVFAGMVEPVKEYEREQYGPYTIDTPLIHLVDAVPPENETARQFNREVSDAIEAHGSWDRVRARLLVWRGNEKPLQTLMNGNALLSEVAPLAANASEMTQLGLEALDRLQAGQGNNKSWKGEALARMRSLDVHTGALQLSVAPGITRLINSLN